jgi:hypothetical protein
MRDDDVADFATLLIIKRDSNAAGIDGDTIIDEKAGQALFQISDTLVIKRTR